MYVHNIQPGEVMPEELERTFFFQLTKNSRAI